MNWFIFGMLTISGILIAILWRVYLNAREELAEANLKLTSLEKENEILRTQRDNDITTVDDADRVWDNFTSEQPLS